MAKKAKKKTKPATPPAAPPEPTAAEVATEMVYKLLAMETEDYYRAFSESFKDAGTVFHRLVGRHIGIRMREGEPLSPSGHVYHNYLMRDRCRSAMQDWVEAQEAKGGASV